MSYPRYYLTRTGSWPCSRQSHYSDLSSGLRIYMRVLDIWGYRKVKMLQLQNMLIRDLYWFAYGKESSIPEDFLLTKKSNVLLNYFCVPSHAVQWLGTSTCLVYNDSLMQGILYSWRFSKKCNVILDFTLAGVVGGLNRLFYAQMRVTAAGAANRFHFVENGRPVARNSRPLTCSKGARFLPNLPLN